MSAAKKKPAKRAAVVWEDGFYTGERAEWQGVTLEVDFFSATKHFASATLDEVAGVTRYDFTTRKAAKSAALELAKLVRKWGRGK